MDIGKVEYEVMNKEHLEQVRQLMLSSFYQDEPINQFIGLQADHVTHFLKQFLPLCAAEGVSYVAVDHGHNDEKQQVVGIRLAVLDRLGVEKTEDPFGTSGIPEKVGIVHFLEDLNRDIDFHKLYNTNVVMRFKMLNVLSSHSKRGIASELVRRSMALGREHGAGCVVAEATGVYSQRLYEKLEFQVHQEIFYDDYMLDGNLVFHRNGSIHKSCRLLSKAL